MLQSHSSTPPVHHSFQLNSSESNLQFSPFTRVQLDPQWLPYCRVTALFHRSTAVLSFTADVKAFSLVQSSTARHNSRLRKKSFALKLNSGPLVSLLRLQSHMHKLIDKGSPTRSPCLKHHCTSPCSPVGKKRFLVRLEVMQDVRSTIPASVARKITYSSLFTFCSPRKSKSKTKRGRFDNL